LLFSVLFDRERIAMMLRVAALVALLFNPFVALLPALAAEFLTRARFFSDVVPKSVASTFLTPKGGHA
jgi:hypothetical protein